MEILTGALAAVVWITVVWFLNRNRANAVRIPIREQERWAAEQLYGKRR